MRIHLGSDHAGFELKEYLVGALRAAGHDVTDHGPAAYDPQDDYPPFCIRVALAVVEDTGSLGVVIGGSGNGEQIAANKVRGVRAALVWNLDTARLARRHNDANVASIGARQHSVEDATTFVEAFLAESFSGDVRHMRRVGLVRDYETTGRAPSLGGEIP
jgi:ribose 5-phosphate isomerase B